MTTAEKCTVIKYHSTLICALNVVSQTRELKSRSMLSRALRVINLTLVLTTAEKHATIKNIAVC